jgi:hypothetical protein
MGNLVEGRYVFNFESVGTGNNVIIERSLFEVYKEVHELFGRVSEEYLSRFFDINKNIIRYVYELNEEHKYVDMSKYEGNELPTPSILPPDVFKAYVFDPYVMYFLSTRFRIQPLVSQGFSVMPAIPVYIDQSYKDIYKYTIFNAITQRDPKLIQFYEYYITPFNPRSVKELQYSGWYIFQILRGQPVDRCFTMYPKKFITNIINNILYDVATDSGDDIKYNLFIKFINNKNYIPSKEELAAFNTTLEFIPNNILYGISPLVLYICSYYKSLILSKTM